MKTKRRFSPFSKHEIAHAKNEISKSLIKKMAYQTRKIRYAGKKSEQESLLTIQEFEKKFHITYYPELRFATPTVEKKVRQKYKKALYYNMIEKDRIWLGAYYSPFFRRGYVNQISIRWISDQVGHGVFAEKTMKPREYIGEYTGLLIRHPYFAYSPNDYSFSYTTPSRLPSRFSINSLHYGNEMRFLNHSDTPNCEAVGVVHDGIMRIIIRTFKPVAKGEQLTYDYGPDYWKRRNKISL